MKIELVEPPRQALKKIWSDVQVGESFQFGAKEGIHPKDAKGYNSGIKLSDSTFYSFTYNRIMPCSCGKWETVFAMEVQSITLAPKYQ